MTEWKEFLDKKLEELSLTAKFKIGDTVVDKHTKHEYEVKGYSLRIDTYNKFYDKNYEGEYEWRFLLSLN